MRVMNEKEVKAVNGGSDNGIAYKAGYAVGQVVDAMVNTAKEAWSGFCPRSWTSTLPTNARPD